MAKRVNIAFYGVDHSGHRKLMTLLYNSGYRIPLLRLAKTQHGSALYNGLLSTSFRGTTYYARCASQVEEKTGCDPMIAPGQCAKFARKDENETKNEPAAERLRTRSRRTSKSNE